MNFRVFSIICLVFVLSPETIEALQHQSIRQKRQTACETPNGIIHSFHLFTYYNCPLFSFQPIHVSSSPVKIVERASKI